MLYTSKDETVMRSAILMTADLMVKILLGLSPPPVSGAKDVASVFSQVSTDESHVASATCTSLPFLGRPKIPRLFAFLALLSLPNTHTF